MSRRRRYCDRNLTSSCCCNCADSARSTSRVSRDLSGLSRDRAGLISSRAPACKVSEYEVGGHPLCVAYLECSYHLDDLGRGRGANGSSLPWPCTEACAVAG